MNDDVTVRAAGHAPRTIGDTDSSKPSYAIVLLGIGTRNRQFLMTDIKYSDTGFDAEAFVTLARRVWPRAYDLTAAAAALARTTNIGAWEEERLVGAVRVLTDGYFFATVPEILVDPDYQRRGIGRELMFRALAAAPRGRLFFGAQPPSVGFFERLGCEPGPTGMIMRSAPRASHPREAQP